MRIEDLIQDPTFRNWANGAPSEDVYRWDVFLTRHPDLQEMLMTAREMVRAQPFIADRPDPAQRSKAWSRIQKGIRRHNTRVKRRGLIGYAAAVLVVGVVAFSTIFLLSDKNNTAWITERTAHGEIRPLTLDDGTHVTLNGNSELHYPSTFRDEMRSVRLRGEAYFEVSHLVTSAPFEVRAGSATIEVLGTTFNVKSRHTRAAVSLIEGKVEVSGPGPLGTVTLLPGQTAELIDKTIGIIEDDVYARASWRSHLWVFDETPLSEILLSLDESFGVTSQVGPEINLEKTISGRLSTKNLSTLYIALETMFNVEIKEQDSGILIQKQQ